MTFTAIVLALSLAGAGCGRALAPTATANPSQRAGASGVDLVANAPSAPGAAAGGDARVGGDLPPTVTITSPQPNPFLASIQPPQFTIHWSSVDPDGPGPGPRSYRYRVFHENDPEFPILLALIDPDSLRAFYAPRFEGWTEVSGKVESAIIQDQPVNERCLFVITAFDRRGAYDPVFSLSRNMLYFMVSPVAGADGTVGESAQQRAAGGHPAPARSVGRR